jgi:hypothetical protein
MPCFDIEAMIREINSLLDQQLAFLNRDLQRVDVSGWLEYEQRYSRIHVLCEQLGGEVDLAGRADERSLMVI